MNNSFEKCISDICGVELSSLVQGKYSVFANRYAVIEGHRGICDYQADKVSFLFGKNVLVISGANLQIRCLEKNYAVVAGEVFSVAVQND
ncbi:MAG: YabP/YqfC family sporulation protein [Corallococcus sp.]|nr:YabP/YqfC family sporulation protein [Corallococcus sp.]MCM1359838.1 YabP/YqfC family sporulation protein [Corallococcus sp.]MCM1395272.1 YabP/YqfC family sporulation protein [Corallococcus sp.]